MYEAWVDRRMDKWMDTYKEVWTEYDGKRMERRKNEGKGI